MSLLALESNPRLCFRCASVDLDGALDPRQFDKLPPLHSPGDTPWQDYMRKVMIFTMDSVESGRSFCELCSFLWLVASVAQRYDVGIPFKSLPLSKPSQPIPPGADGDAFTLATTSSQFIYPTSLSVNPGADASCRTEDAGAWLAVVKGSHTLEPIAGQYLGRNFAAYKIPKLLLGDLAISLKTLGTWIAEASNDVIFNTCAPIRGRRLVGDVDFALVRSWLNLCFADHPSCASSSARDKQAIPHMKLIDCHTQTIVTAAPSMQYLALSYVWGQGPLEKYTYPNLPDPLPPTIKDAITVTLKLGYRYIWVDRYCIWQDDPAHKAGQILRMMDIYSRAVATIAAASSGSDPTYGLPGVSAGRGRQLRHQMAGQVGNRILISGATHRRQEEAIEKSVWDSRAWTFQEAALSRRILYFTDVQVSFLCAGFEAYEHLSRPLALLDTHGGPRTSKYGVNDAGGASSLVYLYSRRAMTYSSDTLNACLGVLTMWSSRNENCHHYWAIPVILPAEPGGSGLNLVLWKALGWRLSQSDIRSGKRRAGFPTWSWLAIEGRGIQLGLRWTAREENTTDPGYDFNVTTKQGEKVKWCEFVRAGGLLRPPSHWGVHLHIQGWVFGVGPFVGVTFKKSRMTVYYTKLPDFPNSSTLKALKFLPDVGIEFAAEFMLDRLEAISTYTYNRLEGDFAIVFQTQGTAKRRIGLLQLAECSVVESEGEMSYGDVHATVDMEVLGARWDSICLE